MARGKHVHLIARETVELGIVLGEDGRSLGVGDRFDELAEAILAATGAQAHLRSLDDFHRGLEELQRFAAVSCALGGVALVEELLRAHEIGPRGLGGAGLDRRGGREHERDRQP